jgi:hypothetical protein
MEYLEIHSEEWKDRYLLFVYEDFCSCRNLISFFLLCHLEVDDVWWKCFLFLISRGSRILNTIYFLLDRRVLEGVEVSEIGMVVRTRMRL